MPGNNNINLLYLLVITKIKQHYLTAIVLLLMLVWSILFRLSYLLERQKQEALDEPRSWEPHVLKESCYMVIDDDRLTSINNKTVFPDGSIFFHETSCAGRLNFRQACAVESAARFHPKRQVIVLFTASVTNHTMDNSCLTTLLANFDNVNLARIYVPDYVENTPVREVIYTLVQDAERLDPHVKKVTKYLTMSKFGGIFLDLNVIVARPLDNLWKNWAVRDSPKSISTAMVAFSRNKVGRSLSDLTVRMLHADVVLNKGKRYWSVRGPKPIEKALQFWCATKNIELMTLAECHDITVYGPDLFYNISFHERIEYFKPITVQAWMKWKSKGMYTFHVFHRSTDLPVISKNSLFAKIAAEYCPVMYKNYASEDEYKIEYDRLC